MNIQRITLSGWSIYLLKYTMKSELYSAVKFEKRNTKCLGLENASEIEIELIAATILGKPVTPCEVALTCLIIPIVKRSGHVVYANSKPPKIQSRLINSRSRTLSTSNRLLYG